METTTAQYFNNLKNSDTLVIYGSGYSIRTLSEKDKKKLSQYDSIGFNWFCKSHIPTTFYVIREQCLFASSGYGEGRVDLIRNINKYYNQSFLIVIDMKKSGVVWRQKKGWKNSTKYFRKNRGIVLKEKFFEHIYKSKKGDSDLSKMGMLIDEMKHRNIYRHGIIYHACTMSNVIHFAVHMIYKKMIFVGVDLYDHRYFWLPKNKLRNITKMNNRKIDEKHKTAKFMCNWAKNFSKIGNIEVYVHNPKSLIAPFFHIWESDDE